jgi:outer membrane receptor protein involved in Fe transport
MLSPKTPLALAVATVVSVSAFADDTELDKVVVTGGKIERDLQATTSGIDVIDSDALEANNTYNLSDALALTPNAAINGRGGFSIRGINAEGGPTSDTATADTASVVMDGAYFDADVLEMGLAMWDIENIEVYKGPQSTSHGKNTLAGAIVVNSKDPVFYREGSVRLGFGSDNSQITSLMFNEAITDEFAIRFAGERVYTDGQLKNEFSGDEDEARDEHINGRIKLLYKPTDNFTALLTIGQDKVESGDDRACGKNTTKPGVFSCKNGDSKAYRDVSGEHLHRLNYQTLKLESELSDDWSFASITSNSRKTRDESTDADNMAPTNSGYNRAADLGARVENEVDSSISQEFRFNFDGEEIRASVGYFYSDTEETRRYDFLLANPLDSYLTNFTQVTSLLAQMIPTLPSYANGVSDVVLLTNYQDSGSTRQAKNHAVFGELDWKITDQTTALFGLRLEQETNRNTAGVSARNVNPEQMDAINSHAGLYFNTLSSPFTYQAYWQQLGLPQQPSTEDAQRYAEDAFNLFVPYLQAGGVDTSGGPGQINFQQGDLNKVLDALALAGSNTSRKDNTNNVVLPKLGIRHEFTDNIGAGYVISRGYRSGGISLNPVNPQKPTVEYDPEFVTNHELSFRSTWMDNRLIANANVYYMKWKDQQVQVLGSNIYDRYITNSGSSSLKGFEVDVSFHGDGGLRVFANYGLSKTRYDEFKVGNKDYSGNSFQYAPKNNAVVGLGFDQGYGISAYLITNYTGESYLNNENTRKLKGYTLSNLRVGYKSDFWQVNGYVNNVFDKRAIAYEYNYDDFTPDPNFVLYGDYNRLVPKRSFGLVAQYDF